MYPYQKPRKFTSSPIGANFKPIDADEKTLSDIAPGSSIIMHDANVEQFAAVSQKSITGSIEAEAYAALSSILMQRLQYLQALRGFTEQYSTVEKNREMMAYWKVCSSLKV
jgi:hypothetical protein